MARRLPEHPRVSALRLRRSLLVLLLVGGSGCYGGLSSRTDCDPAGCVTSGAALGEPCQPSGPACGAGLICAATSTAGMRCARACTRQGECGGAESCVSDGSAAHCARLLAPGAACAPERFEECAGAAGLASACIDSGTADGGARCHLRCTVDGGACPGTDRCSAPLADGQGVCAPPTAPGEACRASAFAFCSSGQLCVAYGDRSACAQRCAADADCLSNVGEACRPINACAAEPVTVCARVRAEGAPCGPEFGTACSAGLACVERGGVRSCRRLCSGQEGCEPNQACAAVPSGTSAPSCQSVCL